MRRISSWLIAIFAVVLVVLGGIALAAQDKYTVQVPGGLAFSEFRGYEDWPVVAVSHPDGKLNVIVANTAMIEAYLAGIPNNGQPFPDGSKMAKIAWKPKQSEEAPFAVSIPDTLMAVGFMVKDSQRFADTGGWGWADFDYDPASDMFTPNTSLQGSDAKCGFACHTIVEAKDYVFTAYGKR
ncbi:MAG TPA: cytochrome P460 family protein [Nitrospira sp.]|nr:cytochrome P460 family protein [Nitrospira sp.]